MVLLRRSAGEGKKKFFFEKKHQKILRAFGAGADTVPSRLCPATHVHA